MLIGVAGKSAAMTLRKYAALPGLSAETRPGKRLFPFEGPASI
jgi:hypothetical protein